MSAASRYADDHPDAAQSSAPAEIRDPRRPLVLDRDHVWDVLHALEQKIGAQEWDMSLDAQDTALERLAHEATLLGRLAHELRAQVTAPYEYGVPAPEDPAEFLKELQIELRDERDGEPEVILTGTDLDEIVYALRSAVSTFAVPSLGTISEESRDAFFRLATLGRVLSKAAAHAGGYVATRHYNMQRLRGEWPYGLNKPEEATSE